jgi:hypothetical protein
VNGLPRGPLYLAAGLPAAIALAWLLGETCAGSVFFLGLTSAFHEAGHAAVGWFFGRPSIPMFILAYTAAPSTGGAIVVCALLAFGAWHWREEHPRLAAVLLGLAILQPILAFGTRQDLFVLLGGHGGEIAAGLTFLVLATRGGVYEEWEQPGYATLGWLLVGRNVVMCWNLIHDEGARWYYQRVSIIEDGNDYVRVAEALGWRLESVARLMLAVAVIGTVAVIVWDLTHPPAAEIEAGPTLRAPGA